ncbi:MAG: DNA recombination protein RmuC, partial [Spirochaetota bacterium]
MTPVVFASIVLALVAVVVAIVAIVVASRRRGHPPEVPAILQQIDSVRGELRDLTDLFLVPQRRGAVGETLLGELLASWLPEGAYELQYRFANGARVDAVVRLGAKLVPVDSKFPLEAMRRAPGDAASAPGGAEAQRIPADVRRAFAKHIADIAERYIRPTDGTMSFALMYIPSERVYVELFASGADALMRQALER